MSTWEFRLPMTDNAPKNVAICKLHYFPKRFPDYFGPAHELAFSNTIWGSGYIVFQEFDDDALGQVASVEEIPWKKIDQDAFATIQLVMLGLNPELTPNKSWKNKRNAQARHKLEQQGSEVSSWR